MNNKKNFTGEQLQALVDVFGDIMKIKFNTHGNITIQPTTDTNDNYNILTIRKYKNRLIVNCRIHERNFCPGFGVYYDDKEYPLGIKHIYHQDGGRKYKEIDWTRSGNATFEETVEYLKNYFNKKRGYNF
ncbi:MAG: hypothetical protein J6D03_07255 [Clostridia bacterium]|nr:hypothetical protein [Clostridia bacterium]